MDPKSVTGQFAQRLDAMLAARRLTVVEFAAACARAGLPITDGAVQKWLRGRAAPNLDDLPKIAKALGLAHWQDVLPPRKRS